MGLEFTNPLGIAAGLDRGGLGRPPPGFGAREIGTLTPRPEPGHNPGLAVLRSTRHRRGGVRLGINLGPNRDTPPAGGLDDYRAGLRAAWRLADYIALNFSAPQTRGLLAPERRPALLALLRALKAEQCRLGRHRGRYVPLALKLPLDPDLPLGLPVPLLAALVRLGFEALIAVQQAEPTPGPEPWRDSVCQQRACAQLRRLCRRLGARLPVIAVGGIRGPRDAQGRLRAGAALVQVHRALLPGGSLHRRRPDLCWRRLAVTWGGVSRRCPG